MDDDRSTLSPILSTVLAFGGPLAYGFIARLIFGESTWPGWFQTLSAAFLCVVPFALGSLTVFLASSAMRRNLWYVHLAPLFSSGAFMLAVAILAWEAWICVVMASPIFLVASMFGGLFVFIIFKIFDALRNTTNVSLIVLILLAPYFIAPLESRFPPADKFRTVESVVVVNAPPEAVWQNIIRLPPIAESERPQNFFRTAGLPRPMEALLDREGVGGIRAGQWEDGLIWIGTITEWSPDQGFTVTLEADTSRVQSPLPLKGIGGPNFDMVDDRYWIEPRADGKVNLHLYSTYRLTTRFNAYGSLWVDFLLRDIQNHILYVVKHRSEVGL
ncbi:MAG TPA: hypothetical protein VI547_09515 [Anaerolineales bacterium]|nr:hypothetical protein [Anaerolineales bacterium]